MSHTEKDNKGLRIASKTNHILDLEQNGNGLNLFREALGEMGFTFISRQVRRSKGVPASVLFFQHSGEMDLTIVYSDQPLGDGVYTDGCRELNDKRHLPHQIRLFFTLKKNDERNYILTNSQPFLTSNSPAYIPHTPKNPPFKVVEFPIVLEEVIRFFRSSYVELSKNNFT